MSAEAKEPGGLVPGRIVHYVDVGGNPLPAIVVDATAKRVVDLWVFNHHEPYYRVGIKYDSAGAPGTWHWMFEGQESRYRSAPPSDFSKVDKIDEAAVRAEPMLGVAFHPRYPWVHRSAKMHCATCMWFVRKVDSILGRCRKNAPAPQGFVPVYESDWCGQHRLDEAKA